MAPMAREPGRIDARTINAYDSSPEQYADEWHSQPAAADLHELVHRYFRPGPTADIGCGSGRDTAWLAAQGFEAIGYDVSAGLLGEARRRYPGIPFRVSALPELAGIDDASFENALCETVVMHLPVGDIPASVSRLCAILRQGGTMYLSWRVTEDEDQRTEDCRLYSAFAPDLVLGSLQAMTVLRDEQSTSTSSGRTVHRLVARRTA
jgi:SAM-dependent methyltransferase